MPKYEMPPFLLSIDPGATTGIALIDCRDPENVYIVWSKETDFDDTCDWVNSVCSSYRGMVRVLVESFVITPQTGKNSQAGWSLELIGVSRYLARVYGCGALVKQTPQKAKNFCPNDRLKRVGFWYRGGKGHARDALRHAVTHLVDCGWTHPEILQ